MNSVCVSVPQYSLNHRFNLYSVRLQVLPALLGNKSFQFSFDDNGNGQVGYVIKNFGMVTEGEEPSKGGADFALFEVNHGFM